MKVFVHRVNSSDRLREIPLEFGVEIDIRSSNGEINLSHDVGESGERFDVWLEGYNHAGIIINVKEDGLEAETHRILDAHGVSEFFFLDQSFPALVASARMGRRNCAVRISEYESPASALLLAGQLDWVWADCFDSFAFDFDELRALQEGGFRVCLVSPELQGRRGFSEVRNTQKRMHESGWRPDAVCTKYPEHWAFDAF